MSLSSALSSSRASASCNTLNVLVKSNICSRRHYFPIRRRSTFPLTNAQPISLLISMTSNVAIFCPFPEQPNKWFGSFQICRRFCWKMLHGSVSSPCLTCRKRLQKYLQSKANENMEENFWNVANDVFQSSEEFTRWIYGINDLKDIEESRFKIIRKKWRHGEKDDTYSWKLWPPRNCLMEHMQMMIRVE